MKPNFALNLSHEGIVLLHRSPRSTWTEVGEVALDDPDLRENLSFLRSTAVGLEGKGFGTKLILPSSQVLYLEVHAPGPGEAERMAQIVKELEGKTPYEVADLSIDWTGAGPNVQVAVVANVTLDEAEEFAVTHRFNPISFTSRASDEPDAWEPFFGRTDYSFTLFGPDVDVRETPAIVPVTNADLNVFQGGEGDDETANETAVAPEMASETEEDEASFFQPEPEPEPEDEPHADINIFNDPDVPLTQAEGETPARDETVKDLSEDSRESEPAAAVAFSSRRQSGDAPALGAPERRLDKVAPRIAISPALPVSGEDSADPKPAPPVVAPLETPTSSIASQPDIVAEDRLRASLLGDEDEAKEAARLAFITRLSPILGGLVLRARYSASKLGAIGLPTIAALRARVKKTGPEVEPEAVDPAIAGEEPAPEDSSQNPDQRKRRVLYSVAALVILGLLGLVYAFSSSDQTGAAGKGGTPLSTTAASSGVRQDNRPQARPSDFAQTVALQSEKSSAGTAIKPIRPQRRSLFEGGVDPEANLPDTAEPATDLTPQELADIEAAGLIPPTQEEIAESGDGLEAGQLAASELAALYEKSGILQGISGLARQNPEQERDDIFVAALDRGLKANDATILPNFNGGVQDDPPARKRSPLPADTVFNLDERGFVIATKEGTLNPDGILVRLGKPPVTPPEKPTTGVFAAPTPLASIKPRPRPSDLKTGEDAIYAQGSITLARLRAMKPKPRPESEQIELAAGDTSVSDLAVLTSFQPAKRPKDFDATVEKTRIQIALAIAAANPKSNKKSGGKKKGVSNVDVAPILPTRASVAKTATIKNAISLSKVSLIGVYGTPSKRAALLRLPSGRFVRVKVGDRVDGGRVAGIDVSSLSYVKKGRNRVLKVPK
jgi:hypothetical protein